MKGLSLIFQFLFENEYSKEALKEMGLELKNYASLQKEYIKLYSIEKLIQLFSALFLCLIFIILGLIIIFYLSFAIVFKLVPIAGGLPMSLIIVSCFLILLGIIIYFFRRPLIEKPVTNLLTNILYK